MKRARKQTRTPQAVAPARSPLDDLPFEVWSDYLAGLKLLVTPGGRALERIMQEYAHCSWDSINTLPWSDAPDTEVAVLSVLSGAFLVPILAMQEPDPYLAVYLGLLDRREGLNLKRIKEDLFLATVILRAFGEYQARVGQHPVGALLQIAASAEDVPPQVLNRSLVMRERTSEEWIKKAAWSLSLSVGRASSRHRVGETIRGKELSWLHGVLGEADATVAKEEAVGWLGVRLAEELHRLEAIPYPELVAKAMSGELNFHKTSAKQAVLRGQRPPRERHQGPQIPPEADEDTREEAARLADMADPVADSEIFEAATTVDQEPLAADVNKKYRLTEAGRRVIEQYLTHLGRPTKKEIATLAQVDLTTVKNTLKKIQKDPSKLRDLDRSVL